MDVHWNAEVYEEGGKLACLQVGAGEHAEEVDGGEVEELDWGVDEDADAEGRGFRVCCGGCHDGCVV